MHQGQYSEAEKFLGSIFETFYNAADNFKQKGELYRFNILEATIAANPPLVSRVFSGLGYDP